MADNRFVSVITCCVTLPLSCRLKANVWKSEFIIKVHLFLYLVVMCLVFFQVLAQEVGEGVSVQSLLNGSTGWRGRAQQVAALQKRVCLGTVLFA
jgi:hypothetical protein